MCSGRASTMRRRGVATSQDAEATRNLNRDEAVIARVTVGGSTAFSPSEILSWRQTCSGLLRTCAIAQLHNLTLRSKPNPLDWTALWSPGGFLADLTAGIALVLRCHCTPRALRSIPGPWWAEDTHQGAYQKQRHVWHRSIRQSSCNRHSWTSGLNIAERPAVPVVGRQQ